MAACPCESGTLTDNGREFTVSGVTLDKVGIFDPNLTTSAAASVSPGECGISNAEGTVDYSCYYWLTFTRLTEYAPPTPFSDDSFRPRLALGGGIKAVAMLYYLEVQKDFFGNTIFNDWDWAAFSETVDLVSDYVECNNDLTGFSFNSESADLLRVPLFAGVNQILAGQSLITASAGSVSYS